MQLYLLRYKIFLQNVRNFMIIDEQLVTSLGREMGRNDLHSGGGVVSKKNGLAQCQIGCFLLRAFKSWQLQGKISQQKYFTVFFLS